ncbi:MAG: nucleotidyltransferase domain-containing protein [Candidatus Aenigmarchaeota archaeon]|nr:nucleotidyltransferase domain-containing protein [Candidatus Aenigmarchaeota archaeon]
MIFPITKSRYKVLRKIYENPGINISELVKETRTAPNIIYKHINDLKNSEVIKEVEIGKNRMKKIYPNLKSENGKLVFSLIEMQKKEEFFVKYKSLKGPFIQLLQNLPNNVVCILVFGSYARFSAEKESDLDLLFITTNNKTEKIERILEESFVTFGKVSARLITIDEFTKSKDTDTMLKQIIKEHICVFNACKFVELISE